MTRRTLATLTVVLALATPAVADRHGEARHTGTIVEVDEQGRTIVLEEMVAWHGPDRPGIVRRSITVTPETSLQVVERTATWGAARTSLPGWNSERLAAADLRPGDFVTVTIDPATRSRAVSMQVLRPNMKEKQ